MSANHVNGDLRVAGVLTVDGLNFSASGQKLLRSQINADTSQMYFIEHDRWRQHDAFHTPLTSPAAGAHLGLIGGSYGAASPTLQTKDQKSLGPVDAYARALAGLPPEYEDAGSVVIRAAARVSAAADTTATLLFEAHESDKNGGVGANLVSTGATSINSATWATYDFIVDANNLAKGDVLDVRTTVNINDAAGVSPVIGYIGWVALLLTIRG